MAKCRSVVATSEKRLVVPLLCNARYQGSDELARKTINRTHGHGKKNECSGPFFLFYLIRRRHATDSSPLVLGKFFERNFRPNEIF